MTQRPGQPATPDLAVRELAEGIIRRLRDRDLTIATCESITGGGVAAALTDVPGASTVVRGGLVTYATSLKVDLAGVDADWVRRYGVINETTAVEMARGALERCGALVAVACTGVAGPDPQDGHQPGDVWLAVAMHAEPQPAILTRHLTLSGDRAQIRHQTVVEALQMVFDQMR